MLTTTSTIDVTVLADHRVELKEIEKLDIYPDFSIELKRL